MILGADDLNSIRTLRTEICIVGAGAAGITLACELDGAGMQVLLVDAGQLGRRGTTEQDPYVGTSEGVHPTPAYFRRRGFGGSTAIWGGRCVPYDPIDFEARDYVAGSGWPITYEEVAQFYPKALRYCDAGEFIFDARRAFTGHREMIPGLSAAHELQTHAMERYSLPTNFAVRYRARLAASTNVRVLGATQALRLIRDATAERISALECQRGGQGPLLHIEARRFVLAIGGIETPRLLLASESEGAGLGNRSDCLGRYYACHIENVLGTLRPRVPGTVFGFETTSDGVYGRRKLLIEPQVQRRERLRNIAFRLHYPNVSDPLHRSSVLSAVYLAKRTLIPEYRRILQHGVDDRAAAISAHLRNVACGLPSLASFGAYWLRRRVFAERKLPYMLVANADGSYPIEFNSEQTPLRDSRITLANTRDRFGMPRVHITWRVCDEDIDSVCRAYRLLRRNIQSIGTADLEFDDDGLRAAVAASIPVGGHHIGTTRMAATAASGVVDRDCAVFDLPNLFIAGASVFPTSSHANPTLTLVALSIRLAGHLRAQCAREGVRA